MVMKQQLRNTWWLLACLAVCPLTAEAQIDDLLDEASAGSDKRDKRNQPGEGEPEEADVPLEPDPWERPPKDEEPAPKAKPAPAVSTPSGDGRDLQLGLAIGYGFESATGDYAAHPYNLGFGLRLGYTLDMGLFIGLGGTYYLGGTQENTTSVGVAGASQENTINALTIAPEVGYDVWLGPIVLRPSVEIGALITFQSNDANFSGQASSDGAMYLGPGFTVLVPLDEYYLGGDGRFVIPIGEGDGTFALSVVGGLRFDTDLF